MRRRYTSAQFCIPHLYLHFLPTPQVTSELLSNVIGNQLAPYLQDEGCIRLIQCFLDPKMFCHPESPNPLQKDSSEKDDVLHQLFVPHEDQQIGEGICCKVFIVES